MIIDLFATNFVNDKIQQTLINTILTKTRSNKKTYKRKYSKNWMKIIIHFFFLSKEKKEETKENTQNYQNILHFKTSTNETKRNKLN